ncbi:hypothetical protein Bbelb_039700 [Branchiostoma belcheri]|nr:hypothetical protein Bbelb_039700 [Branchiostoma belcheri]
MRVTGEKMLYADQWAQGSDIPLSLPYEHIGSLFNKENRAVPKLVPSVIPNAHGVVQTDRPAATGAGLGDEMCCTTPWVRPVYGDWVWKAPSVCGRTLAAGHDGMWSGREEGFWHQPAYRVNRALFPVTLQVSNV